MQGPPLRVTSRTANRRGGGLGGDKCRNAKHAQANNVPLGTALAISVVTEGVATRATFNSTPLAGTLTASTATASVTLPPGTSVLTATATFVAP